MADPREKIIAKIRALRAWAHDAASSEAEVEAAARHAARLIAEHELTEADLREAGTAGVCEGRTNVGRRTRHPTLEYCGAAIGELTECKAYSSAGENVWIGQQPDVLFATYLAEMIQAAAERQWSRHMKGRYSGQAAKWARYDYMASFGAAIARRLRELSADRRAARGANTSGTDIVPLKGALIDAWVAEQYHRVTSSRRGARRRPVVAAAFYAGQFAAQAVPLDRPIEDGRGPGVQAIQ